MRVFVYGSLLAGEVCAVDRATLVDLDRLEGHPRLATGARRSRSPMNLLQRRTF